MMLVMLWPCWPVCIQTTKSSCGLPSYWCCAQTCPNIWPKPSQAAQMMLVMLLPCWAVCIQTAKSSRGRFECRQANRDRASPASFGLVVKAFAKYLDRSGHIMSMMGARTSSQQFECKQANRDRASPASFELVVKALAKYLDRSEHITSMMGRPDDAGDALALLACLH